MEPPAAAPRIVMQVDSGVASHVRLGFVGAAPVVIGPSPASLIDALERRTADLRSRFAGCSPARIDELRPARELYRSFGVDPTKVRPSSEALLRRVLRGRPLPRISNAVDLCNLLSVSFLLPMGLYDAGAIEGSAVEVRRGRPGEAYTGIRKGEVHLEGRLVLADAAGPFGNPTSDSSRTAVTDATRGLWMVILAPASIPSARLQIDVASAGSAVARHLGRSTGTPEITSGVVADQ